MPPASRPALSWLLPSVGETLCDCAGEKFSGSAPYLSWLASVLAELESKLPLIWVEPPLMPSLFEGIEMTWPSKVKPTQTAQGLEPLAAPQVVTSPVGLD